MIHSILADKPARLFIFLSSFFVANALIAECIGGKIFSLEKLFGLVPASFTIFGEKGLSFNLTAGVILWPLQFVMTDKKGGLETPAAFGWTGVTGGSDCACSERGILMAFK